MINHNTRRKTALLLVILFIVHCLEMPLAHALTGGPSQPEVQSFEPVGTTDMVDLFTGDFTYNIPLFELPGPNGGYPFNLSYHAGIGMDQEASWVGLGWNLNPGAITRNMRGLPDEFKGDEVKTKMAIDPSITVGVGAGAGVEIFGQDPILNLTMGLSVYNNNYKGVGYKIDGSFGYGKAHESGFTHGASLGFSLDNQQGIDLSPSIGLSDAIKKHGAGLSLGAGYNSREGLRQITTGITYAPPIADTKNEKGKTVRFDNVNLSSTLSLSHPGYTPQISMPMRNVNISASIKLGGSFAGVFASPYLHGFYHEQWLKNNKVEVPYPAYGYLNYQDAPDGEGNILLDFNREKDGVIRKESPNLPIPSLTYDIYSVNGQGLSAMYRPFRSDRGIIHDPIVSTFSTGAAVGVDAAPAASHGGVNLQVNHGASYSGPWQKNAPIADNLAFQQKTYDDPYEPWYFKVHGEPSAQSGEAFQSIGEDDPVRVKLSGSKNNPVAEAVLENRNWSGSAPQNDTDHRERTPRSQVITPITNEELLQGQQEAITPYRITYLDASDSLQTLDRSQYPGHHQAGMSVLTQEGLRYYYALPAYNHYQEETQFSTTAPPSPSTRVDTGNEGGEEPDYEHDGTQSYLKRTEIPPYAHSYMLTAIVGPDYVDVTGDGVSEDDLGYWVKFTYQQVTDDENYYHWRAPFSKALYHEGLKSDPRDDQGSFTYGKKEIWYLAKAETKSHIATFHTETREDSRGALKKLQDSDSLGMKLRALKEVQLFTRSAGSSVPLLKVKLEQDYSLCQDLPNQTNGEGKLTLKKVWFEYGQGSRGQLNPYIFTYQDFNPDYSPGAYDRWGNYKPLPPGDALYNHEFPYTSQNPEDKNNLDDYASAWSLKQIKLPSGGTILVDYETDDYAYVQHKTAMQMTSVVDPYADPSAAGSSTFQLQDSDLKVRFKLKSPIEGTLSTSEQKQEVLRYLDKDQPQLYFKMLMDLRSPSEDVNEFITGYADIDFTQDMGLESDGSGYVYGYFHLKAEEGHHPFMLRAWQHLRTNQPELASIGKKMSPSDTDEKRIKQIKGLVSIFPQISQLFKGFYDYCNNKQWGKEVVADKAWIRLQSPDKVKYGGGLRVKQVTMHDAWAQDEEGIYGQVYDYTMEEDGQLISSGVAANEPILGGDENALRYAKKYTQSIPLRSNNNLFFEYPVNESYYPGPNVGYRKVTVKSLAAAGLAGDSLNHTTLSDSNPLFPEGEDVAFGTSGVTVHEFYTAKEFPVIAKETEKDDKPHQVSIPIPFLGNINASKLTASQGYSIITNDMHGKPKKVTQFRLNNDGEIENAPISWITYHYASQDTYYQGEKVSMLQNAFTDNGDETLSLATSSSGPLWRMGQETEFFVDMREHEDKTWTAGANLNTDVILIPIVFAIIPIPIPSIWPATSKSSSRVKTMVANKVIFRSGVMEKVEAYNEGSLITTQHLKWDKLSGQPLLSMVNNNHDQPVYSYTIPAFREYEGMGGAYQNTGLRFNLQNIADYTSGENLYSFTTTSKSINEALFPGDEWILYTADTEDVLGSAVYVGNEGGKQIFYTAISPPQDAKAQIVRSGRRNQLNVPAGSISALQDPSEEGASLTYQKTISTAEN